MRKHLAVAADALQPDVGDLGNTLHLYSQCTRYSSWKVCNKNNAHTLNSLLAFHNWLWRSPSSPFPCTMKPLPLAPYLFTVLQIPLLELPASCQRTRKLHISISRVFRQNTCRTGPSPRASLTHATVMTRTGPYTVLKSML